MSKHRIEVAVHGNGSTRSRLATIGHVQERVIRDAIARQLSRLGCTLIAFGAASDHVHVLFWMSPTAHLSEIFRAMKSASAVEVNRCVDYEFRWEQGYAVFSVDPLSIGVVATYVTNQRTRHAEP